MVRISVFIVMLYYNILPITTGHYDQCRSLTQKHDIFARLNTSRELSQAVW